MSLRKMLITGAGGQLATDLQRALARWNVRALTHRDLDVADALAVEQVMEAVRPDVVINTAAFHRVDDCESQVGWSFAVNENGPRNLARACRRLNAVLVHVSTDYVFDGQKREPYVEADRPNPLNVYGLSKLAGEEAIRAIVRHHLVVRTAGLYGAGGKGRNFVSSMLERARAGEQLRVVDDQCLSPTYTRHLAEKIVWLVENEARGLVHVTNSGSCTWYEFTRAILASAGLETELEPVNSGEVAARARRPAYSVLGHLGLAALGAAGMPPWQEALPQYLLEAGAVPRAVFSGGRESR